MGCCVDSVQAWPGDGSVEFSHVGRQHPRISRRRNFCRARLGAFVHHSRLHHRRHVIASPALSCTTYERLTIAMFWGVGMIFISVGQAPPLPHFFVRLLPIFIP